MQDGNNQCTLLVMETMNPSQRRELLGLHRTLHLVDIENLCGYAHLTADAVSTVNAIYAMTVGVAQLDHVVVGCSHHNGLAAATGWPGARYVWRSGPDGADIALQEVIEFEAPENRFTRVVLATGDGGFDLSAALMITRGLEVIVAARVGSLSSRLRLAAHAVIDIIVPAPAFIAPAKSA